MIQAELTDDDTVEPIYRIRHCHYGPSFVAWGSLVAHYRAKLNEGASYAEYNLGICYENGWGVTKDLGESQRLIRLAAEHGHDAARRRLGMDYNQQQQKRILEAFESQIYQAFPDARGVYFKPWPPSDANNSVNKA
jgi:TPR repeat protein